MSKKSKTLGAPVSSPALSTHAGEDTGAPRKNTPRLRFPEFRDAGAWEEKPLGQLGIVLMCKRIFAEQTNDKGGVPFFKIGTLGGEPDAFIDKELFEEYKSKYNFPRKGEILITCSGTVGKCLRYNGEDAYYQDSNIVWIDNSTLQISNDLLYAILLNVDWRKLNSTTITRIYGSDLRDLLIKFPTDKFEQQKIADCLSSLDGLIAAESEKLDALKTHKKGLMQRLFPRVGETVPRLRFPEFRDAGEWVEKLLGDCLDYLQPTEFLVSSTDYDDKYETPVLTAGKTFILGYTNETKGIFRKNLPVIIFDDFTTASKFVDFPFKAKSSAMKILLPKKGASIKFIHEAMQMLSYEVGVHERHWISIFSKMKVPVPEFKEQQKIADCLSSLDGLIAAQSEKLDALKTHKKGLMQQLFPAVEEVGV